MKKKEDDSGEATELRILENISSYLRRRLAGKAKGEDDEEDSPIAPWLDEEAPKEAPPPKKKS